MGELDDYRERLLERLGKIVDELIQAVNELPPEAWHKPISPHGQTLHYVLAHLRNIEAQALAVRLRRILDEDTPLLSLFDDEAWMASNYQADEPVQVILDDYRHNRQEELSWLRSMPAIAWNRLARHPWWGVRTLQWWVEHSLAHAQEHIQEQGWRSA